MKSVWLMYHNVHENSAASDIPVSASMYHVSLSAFTRQIEGLANSGLSCLTAREYLAKSARDSVVITFDDGWKGAFMFAFPILQRLGLKATFFVTKDFCGRKHFFDQSMIRAAVDSGMEVGVHGTSHRMLSDLDIHTIGMEFADCKAWLEDTIQQTVVSASMPGGDWSRKIARIVEQVGLDSLCTSRPGVNDQKTSLYELRRFAIRNDTGDDIVERYYHRSTAMEKLRWSMYRIPQSLLGMKRYSALRRRLLGDMKTGKTEIFRL